MSASRWATESPRPPHASLTANQSRVSVASTLVNQPVHQSVQQPDVDEQADIFARSKPVLVSTEAQASRNRPLINSLTGEVVVPIPIPQRDPAMAQRAQKENQNFMAQVRNKLGLAGLAKDHATPASAPHPPPHAAPTVSQPPPRAAATVPQQAPAPAKPNNASTTSYRPKPAVFETGEVATVGRIPVQPKKAPSSASVHPEIKGMNGVNSTSPRATNGQHESGIISENILDGYVVIEDDSARKLIATMKSTVDLLNDKAGILAEMVSTSCEALVDAQQSTVQLHAALNNCVEKAASAENRLVKVEDALKTTMAAFKNTTWSSMMDESIRELEKVLRGVDKSKVITTVLASIPKPSKHDTPMPANACTPSMTTAEQTQVVPETDVKANGNHTARKMKKEIVQHITAPPSVKAKAEPNINQSDDKHSGKF